jgi:hypothetical protein
MRYVIVHATGSDYSYAIAGDFTDGLRTYTDWLTEYADATSDETAHCQLQPLNRPDTFRRGQVIEYRSHHDTHTLVDVLPEHVLVLGPLEWPTDWRVPPDTVTPEWGRTVHHLDHPCGAFELRSDGEIWRIFWTDKRSPDAYSITRAYTHVAEASTAFAFIDAYLAHARKPQ